MDEELPVSSWIRRLKEGDEEAAERLWKHFFSRLCRIADGKLPMKHRAAIDEADVASHALETVLRRIKDGQFPKLKDHRSLWHLLIKVVERKAINVVGYETRKKRDSRRTISEELLTPSSDSAAGIGANGILGMEPTPSFVVRMREAIDILMDKLDAVQQETVTLKLEGYSNEEIAIKMGCSVSTVERRLRLIRKTWEEGLSDEGT